MNIFGRCVGQNYNLGLRFFHVTGSLKRFFSIYFTGLFLECPGITSVLLKTNIQHILSPIQSLSIYDFDRTVTTLTNDLFSSSSSGVRIKHLQFSHSNIESLKDNSLISLKDSLESLSIVNGKLRNVSRLLLCALVLQTRSFNLRIKSAINNEMHNIIPCCLDTHYKAIKR